MVQFSLVCFTDRDRIRGGGVNVANVERFIPLQRERLHYQCAVAFLRFAGRLQRRLYFAQRNPLGHENWLRNKRHIVKRGDDLLSVYCNCTKCHETIRIGRNFE